MFHGFSDRTVDFLWGVRFNNSREWLNEHKQDYQQEVQTPLRELANEVFEQMKQRYPELMLQLHISRIYRDARRLFGRGPLKEDLWFSVYGARDVRYCGPEFFFDITPEGYGYGMGVWSADAAAMKRYREDILSGNKTVRSLAAGLAKQERIMLCGEDFARPKGSTEPLLQPWLQKKKVYFECARPYDGISHSEQLVGELVEGFSFLYPYYCYFDGLCRRSD